MSQLNNYRLSVGTILHTRYSSSIDLLNGEGATSSFGDCDPLQQALYSDGFLNRLDADLFHGFQGLLHVPHWARGAALVRLVPLLIFMHGRGEAGHDVAQLHHPSACGPLHNLSMGRAHPLLQKKFIVAAPQVAVETAANITSSQIVAFARDVIDHVEGLRQESYGRLTIDRSRIFISGHSMGGRKAIEVLASPEGRDFFAAVMLVGMYGPPLSTEVLQSVGRAPRLQTARDRPA